MTQHLDEQRRDRMRIMLQSGGVCAIVGTIGYLTLFLLHGDLPDETTESALTWVAQRPFSALHLGIILSILLWVWALVALANSLVHGPAWMLSRLGQATAIVGVTLLAVHYRIDGPALEEVADAWAGASGAEQERLLNQGDLVLLMTGGGFPLYVALLLGVPFLLFGLAVVFSRIYPPWVGWLGAVAGAGSFVVGAANFIGLDTPPIQLFVLFVFLLDIWMLVMGTLMWRRATRLSQVPPRQHIDELG